MARPKKATVDYFPHQVNHGATMFIIEQNFGNDGYAFWFKLLEFLGATENHVIDTGNPAQWEFLLAKTRLNEDLCMQILNLLAKLDAIDRELWEGKQMIWCQKFVDGIKDAYKKREGDFPQKPFPKPETHQENSFRNRKPHSEEVSSGINGESKLKETKEKETRTNTPLSPSRGERVFKTSPEEYSPEFEDFWLKYPKRVEKRSAYRAWKARIADKVEPADLIRAAENYSAFKAAEGAEPRFIKHPATFIGPYKPYEEFIAGTTEEWAARGAPARKLTPLEKSLKDLDEVCRKEPVHA